MEGDQERIGTLSHGVDCGQEQAQGQDNLKYLKRGRLAQDGYKAKLEVIGKSERFQDSIQEGCLRHPELTTTKIFP